jgi:hypothetical protein
MYSTNFSYLSEKHDQWLVFSGRIREGLGNGTDLNTIREYAVYYWQHYIKPHFYLEETVFIPYTNNCYLAGQLQGKQVKQRALTVPGSFSSIRKNTLLSWTGRPVHDVFFSFFKR